MKPKIKTPPETDPRPPRPAFVLASGSPRRREMLERLGAAFTVRPVHIDESPHPGEAPVPYVERLARGKAEVEASPGEIVLAADTIVARDDVLLGKPEDEADATRMLESLSGREHTVSTGVALYDPAAQATLTEVVTTKVRFAPLTAEEIAWYVASGEPMDKAGAYAIQGLGALFVTSIDGNYHNVVGLPLAATYRLFKALGYDLRSYRTATASPA